MLLKQKKKRFVKEIPQKRKSTPFCIPQPRISLPKFSEILRNSSRKWCQTNAFTYISLDGNFAKHCRISLFRVSLCSYIDFDDFGVLLAPFPA